jgi:hypothetical protein
VVVKEKTASTVFPTVGTFRTSVIAGQSPVYLFSAATDHERLVRRWTRQSVVVPKAQPGLAEVRVNIEKLFTPDPENRNGEPIADYSMRYYFRDKVKGREPELADKKSLVFTGRSIGKPGWLQIAFVTKTGTAYGATVQLDRETREHVVPLSALKPVKVVTLPRPYPTFLSYWFESSKPLPFNINEAETIQLSIGPGIPADQLDQPQSIAIESIRVE